MQEYNLVIVTPNCNPYAVASIKINLPIVLPIGSHMELTKTQENLLIDKILESRDSWTFTNYISPYYNREVDSVKIDADFDFIKSQRNAKLIQSITGRLLTNAGGEESVSDNKSFYLDCFDYGLWIIGYEYNFENNEINILTTQDPKTYEEFKKNNYNI